jgi:ATP-dependent RNA helicase HelY
VQITPGEYTQLTGRAGRRGIDTIGHSVIQWVGNMDPASVAGLASKRTYPLVSPFKPTYNMSVNLLEAFGRERAREVLETSFAQFQADRSVVGLAKGIREKQVSLDGYANAMKCHLGEFSEYASARREISDLERVLANGRVRAERGKDIRQSKGRAQQEQRIAQLKRKLKQHPCHACPDREAHARWGERWHKLQRELEATLNQIEGRTNQVARTFDRICDLLLTIGYVQQDSENDLSVTDHGRKLARIYGERDLLVAEAIREGLWNKLDAPGLAAMAAVLVYEARRDEEFEPRIPKGNFAEVLENTEDLWHDLDHLAKQHRLPTSSPLDPGIAFAIHRWASGARLDTVLDLAGLLAGDFIRWCKQIIDLLDQLVQVADGDLSANAKDAIDKVKRGIVAYSFYG